MEKAGRYLSLTNYPNGSSLTFLFNSIALRFIVINPTATEPLLRSTMQLLWEAPTQLAVIANAIMRIDIPSSAWTLSTILTGAPSPWGQGNLLHIRMEIPAHCTVRLPDATPNLFMEADFGKFYAPFLPARCALSSMPTLYQNFVTSNSAKDPSKLFFFFCFHLCLL